MLTWLFGSLNIYWDTGKEEDGEYTTPKPKPEGPQPVSEMSASCLCSHLLCSHNAKQLAILNQNACKFAVDFHWRVLLQVLLIMQKILPVLKSMLSRWVIDPGIVEVCCLEKRYCPDLSSSKCNWRLLAGCSASATLFCRLFATLWRGLCEHWWTISTS